LPGFAENPQANLDVLELMYVCLQFRFEGRFRVIEGGSRQLEAIRQRLLSIIRKQRGEYERDLSGSWQGIGTSRQARLGWMPLWVSGRSRAASPRHLSRLQAQPERRL
jgi:type VI secretion system protein ImpK